MDMERLISELKKNVFEEKENLEIDYSVSWDKAPHWADYHAYDKNGKGFWFGCYIREDLDFFDAVQRSSYTIPDSMMKQHEKTWQNSRIANPYIF